MDAVEKEFCSFIKSHQLEQQKVLIMVSGGVDSMVLAHLCCQFLPNKNLSVLHINHQTRADNQQDTQLVQSFCELNRISFFSETLIKKPTKNKELFWRKARKEVSARIKQQTNSDIILTAHHATDLVETVLFRLTKGGGLKALNPFEINTKPLWKLPKQQLIDYAKNQKITWNEDQSNQEMAFERNKIRHKVVPTLKEITPNLEKVFVNQSINFGEYQDFIQKQIPNNSNVTLAEFLSWHVVIQKEWIKKHAQHSFSAKELNEVLHWLHNNPEGNTKKEFFETTLKLQKGILTFVKKQATCL